MWKLDEITIEIDAVEGSTAIVAIATPVGLLEVIGRFTRAGRVLHVAGAHVQGIGPGGLGRAGLNAVGRKLLVEADVDEIVIEGGARTTGPNKGRAPRPIRFPHAGGAERR